MRPRREPVRRRAAVTAVLIVACAATLKAASAAPDCPWVGSGASPGARAGQVLAQMTRDEKIHMVHGALTDPAGIVGPVYAGIVREVPRLCIPQLGLLDGPLGVGDGLTGGTQLPAPIALAATWDTDLAARYGDTIGAEVDAKGANVSLAPALDIVRDPRAGRGFEAFGEDPYLTSRLGVAETRAIQARGVIAEPKHFAVYNQETLRDTAGDNAIVDERTMHEIYLPAFEAAVTEGGAGSVMCSYNSLNDVHACNHTYLMSQVLKGQWGFEGFVTSDWYGMHASAGSANAGLDLQMPDDCYFGAALERAVDEGRVATARLHDMVTRILRSMFAAGLFDRPPGGTPGAVVTTPAHAALARKVAARGMVLLRNSGVLPLDASDSVALIGGAARERAITGGGGSSAVIPTHVVTPYDGIGARAASVAYDDGTNPATAAGTAASADVAIVFASLMQGEFKDRLSLELFPTDTLLIEAVVAANPRTIVVLNTGSATTMPWLDQVQGVLQAWYPGQEYGHALADVLYGDVNPSGKLPVTFPTSLVQVPANTPMRWPGVGRTEYSEGLAVGYRHYDQNGLDPLFPFGYGLSYTTFALSDLSVTPGATFDGAVTVEADLTNTGDRAGTEVVQLYLSHPSSTGEPPKSLRGFRSVTLEPGTTERVSFALDARALATWDATEHRWIAAPGSYTVRAGTSSRDLPLAGGFALTGELRPGDPTPPPPPGAPDTPDQLARDGVTCPKDLIAPFVNGALSLTGFPPIEILGRPVP